MSPLSRLELFHDNVGAFLTHETSSAPAPGDLVVRNLTANPAPDRFEAGEEVGVLL